jgi:hypothetical protein
MSTPEQNSTGFQRPRLRLFRVLGGVLLGFAILGLAAVAIGVYYTLTESSSSGWFPPILIGSIGFGVLLMGVIGVRALRIKSVEELDEQSRSKWLDL